ncbi:MAG: extracellular solute-binding protein, partial [Spirochaetota bacterium]
MKRTMRNGFTGIISAIILLFLVSISGASRTVRTDFAELARSIPHVDTEPSRIEIDIAEPSAVSDDIQWTTGEVHGEDEVFVWENEVGWIEFSVDVPETDMYELHLVYQAEGDIPEPTFRALRINGDFPTDEAEQLMLPRVFEQTEYPFRLDDRGSQLRPLQREVVDWHTGAFRDLRGLSASPYQFELQAGTNTIRIEGIRGSLSIAEMFVTTPRRVPTYEEYRHGSPESGREQSVSDDALVVQETEDLYRKTNRAIQPDHLAQPLLVPESTGNKRVLNVMGGEGWRSGNDWASWRVEVEESGFYRIAFKYQQDMDIALTSFRTLLVNGVVPFREAYLVGFPFGSSWNNLVLGDETSGAWEIYLHEGANEITLRATAYPYRNLIREAEQIASGLNALDEEIKQVTGVRDSSDVDPFRVYNVPEFIPDVLDRLGNHRDRIRSIVDELSMLNDSDPEEYNLLMSSVADLDLLIEDPERIARRPDTLGLIMTQLFTQAEYMATQPLWLDRFYLTGAEVELPRARPNVFQRIAFMFRSLFGTFDAYYETPLPGQTEAVDVWVRRGRDYVDLVQELADQTFTPETGIEVNVNFIPSTDILILARAAGRAPDVALGVGENIPFDFALRGALVPRDDRPGFDELLDTIVPGALLPYRFEGRHYGLPEEARFPMLFYRRDILEEMDLEVPQTWDDVRDMLPNLQQENRNFFFPLGRYQMWFFQNEVDLYTPDGLDVAWDNPEGVAAFREWTDMYNIFALPVRVENFYQRFRDGSIPIGVSFYSDYVLMQTAAPNITGRWEMVPIPGMYAEDGTLLRWASGDKVGAIMMDTGDEERHDRAWEFLRWWLSTETQAQYANDLEAYYGLEFRWFPANREVIDRQPWDPEVRERLQVQMGWYRSEPFVPGGSYMTERELTNAWNATVIRRQNFREELES